MSSLIKNELTKIFHKKGIYVIGILILGFCLLNNILLKVEYDSEGNYKNNYYNDNTISYIEEELKNLDPNSKDDIEQYISYKNDYDVAVLIKNYKLGSWQYNIVNSKLYDIIHNINYYTLQEKNSELLKEYTNKYNLYLERLNSDNWESFVTDDIDAVTKEINRLENDLTKTSNKQEIEAINNSLKNNKRQLDILNYRIDKNISYADSYLSMAIDNYSNSLERIDEYEAMNELNYQNKKEYYSALKTYNLSKYTIESKHNINQINTLRMGIKDLFNDYQFFIIIIVLIIAGTIVSEEYNKGTIKLLLVKPYKRSTILLSKYLTTIIVLLLTILYTFVIELLVGGITFGFDSLSIPVMVFNYNTMALEGYNVIVYSGIIILSKLPMVILLLTLAFAIGAIFGNAVLATMLTILGFLFGDLLNQIALSYNLNWLKFFVTPNWNFTEYLFGGLPTFKNVNLTFSIIICLVYFLIMIVTTFIVFKKKNIKNQ